MNLKETQYKTKVRCILPIDDHEEEVKIDDIGYIDGYVVRDGVFYVVCIFGKDIVLAEYCDLEVLDN